MSLMMMPLPFNRTKILPTIAQSITESKNFKQTFSMETRFLSSILCVRTLFVTVANRSTVATKLNDEHSNRTFLWKCTKRMGYSVVSTRYNIRTLRLHPNATTNNFPFSIATVAPIRTTLRFVYNMVYADFGLFLANGNANKRLYFSIFILYFLSFVAMKMEWLTSWMMKRCSNEAIESNTLNPNRQSNVHGGFGI